MTPSRETRAHSEGRRVVVALHEEVLGGASLSVVRLVDLLERRGWRLEFWVSRPSPLFEELRARGLEVHGTWRPVAYSVKALRLPPGLRSRFRRVPGYLRAFRDFLQEGSPALVHANSLFTQAEAVVAHSLGLPVVFHVHEMLPAGWKGMAARRIAHSIRGEVVAVSEACAKRLMLGDRRPAVVYECAPYPERLPSSPERAGPTVVGTVGVISTRKGTDVFVEAALLVRERAPEVEFEIVGAPTDALEIDWAADVLSRARAVGVRHEMRADVPARLSEWDVFALPSRRDPFPISVLEAMGSGLPVVGTAVDGIEEQITPEVGVLVPSEDPAALADALIELHHDPGRRRELGRAARERAISSFSLERQAEGLHRAYLAALGGER